MLVDQPAGAASIAPAAVPPAAHAAVPPATHAAVPPSAPAAVPPATRIATRRTFAMVPPTFFDVRYRINPWMDPDAPLDRARAYQQWNGICAAYTGLGHQVHLIDPDPELPDMVFAANGAITSNGRALLSRFAYPQRAGEAERHRAFLTAAGFAVSEPDAVGEGEGDFVHAGAFIVAGTGFRTEREAHTQASRVFQLPVYTVELVDPHFYHLDTALTVLDRDTVACYGPALTPGSYALIRQLFRDVIDVEPAEAAALAANAVSDGRHVVLPADAPRLATELTRRGFVPVPVDVSELRKAGGGPKCVTLELREGTTP